jgi:hypothetical protein
MMVLASGCYLSHERGVDPVDAGTPDAGWDAGSDAGWDAGSDAGLQDAGPPAARFCEAQCEVCDMALGISREGCLRGCIARFEAAQARGCGADFGPWIECIADEGCDASRCLALRSCW